MPPSVADGSRPSEPATTAASSLRMSPKRLSVTTTSKSVGAIARRMANASTYMWCSVTSGYSRPTAVTACRHTRDVSSTLALSTEVTRNRRDRAVSKATRATRSTSAVE